MGMRTGHRRAAAAALALCAIALTAIGCERRIEEPIPPVTSEAPHARQAVGAAPAAGNGDGPAAATAAGRCIHATPPAPSRTLKAPGPDPRCPPDPLDKPPDLRRGKVIFADEKATRVSVEIADKDEVRARGLMFRKHMPEDEGMIFVFQERRNHTFWMHNTCIPLDMLFIDQDGMIVGIEENTTTMDDSTFQVGCPSTYVLELNAGWSRRHGVAAGQKVTLEGI